MTKWATDAEALGLDPTGQADAYPAIRGWLDQLPWVSAPGPLVRAGYLDLGVGRYRLGSPLVIDRSVWIQGRGGELRKPGTVLDTPHGIVIAHATSGTVPSGYGSQLRDLCVHGSGVSARTQVSLIHVLVVGAQVGVEMVGTAGIGNVNGSRLDHVIAEGCAIGIHVYGGDANAIEAAGCRAYGCGEGFVDEGFLGSLWEGCQSEGHSIRGWRVEGQSGGSTLLRCYSEGGGAALQDIVEVPAQVYGGSWNKGVGARAGKVPATWWNANQARGRFVVHNQAPTGAALSLSLGGTDAWHGATLATPDGHVLVAWYDAGTKQIRVNRNGWNGPLVWSYQL